MIRNKEWLENLMPLRLILRGVSALTRSMRSSCSALLHLQGREGLRPYRLARVRRRRALAAPIAALAIAMLAAPSQAGEPLFGYLYTTDTLPKGKVEVEQWITDREGQAHGHYHGVESRTEVEIGLRDNLQLALYKNLSYVDAHSNSVAGYTEGLDLPADHDGLTPYRGWHSDGVSAELVWRVMSPYKHALGVALYVEQTVGPKESGLELRAIVQKNFLQDRLVLAANAWVEFDKEKGSNLGNVASGALPDFSRHKATYIEGDLGISYRFRRNWTAGFEFRNHNEFSGWGIVEQQHTAFFLGPNIHYAGERWFFTLAALRQLAATGFTDDQRAQIARGKLYGDEHTNWDGIRLIFGRTF
jgi:hypothetical protein